MPSQSIDQKTADAAFRHISLWEGFEDTVYADGGGVPHIGYGYALIVKVGDEWEIKTDLKKKLNAAGVAWEKADNENSWKYGPRSTPAQPAKPRRSPTATRFPPSTSRGRRS